MPDSNLEIIQKAMDDFVKIQRHMLIAKKENAVETYASLKKEYLYLKSLLNVAGVNLTDIDEIKEQRGLCGTCSMATAGSREA